MTLFAHEWPAQLMFFRVVVLHQTRLFHEGIDLEKGPFFLFPLKRGLESSPGSVRHRIQRSFNCNTRELGSDC